MNEDERKEKLGAHRYSRSHDKYIALPCNGAKLEQGYIF